MQNNLLTLDAVAQQFKIWRQSKTNKFQPTPLELKQLVEQLLPHYPAKDIIRSLKISKHFFSSPSGAGYKCFSQLATNQSSSQNHNINFIPYSLSSPLSTSNSNNSEPCPPQKHTVDNIAPSSCQIIKSDGSALIFQTKDLQSIIKTFLCYN